MEPSPWDGAGHPNSDLLRRFALGLLGRETTDRVGRHLRDCDACYEIVVTAPDDRLVLLLRTPVVPGNTEEEGPPHATNESVSPC
jgi:hypothetical protein